MDEPSLDGDEDARAFAGTIEKTVERSYLMFCEVLGVASKSSIRTAINFKT